jgi:hypothetical protein
MLVVKLVPAELMAEFRARAATKTKRVSLVGLAIIGAIWLVVLAIVAVWLSRIIGDWTSPQP